MSHPVAPRHYPPGLVAEVVVSALAARHRPLLMDMAALAATFHPPLQMTSPDESLLACRPGQAGPAGPGRLLIVFNHYSRAGVPAWWTAISLGGALVQVGLTEPEPRWVMTDTLNYLGWLAPLSRWVLRRIAWTYNAFSMPPMPPSPQARQACASTVRRVIAFARQQPAARVCLAPEGRDSGDGSLIAPPAGAGRFILQLCRTGMTVLPAGVCEDGGTWHVRFGSAFTLSAPADLSTDERDGWAVRRVMGAIAALLPRRLRGAYQVFP